MRLLILSCSKEKNPGPELMPAILRYQSPAFNVVRKYINSSFANSAPASNSCASLAIWILSGKHGLIEAGELIGNYDLKLTPENFETNRSLLIKQARKLSAISFNRGEPTTVFCHLPKLYGQILSNYLADLSRCCVVEYAVGPPGKKLQQLKAWLNRSDKE